MQLNQMHLALTHACMISAEQTLSASRANVKLLSLKYERTGSGVIYNQMQTAKRHNTIYFLAYRTSKAAYAKALKSFHKSV